MSDNTHSAENMNTQIDDTMIIPRSQLEKTTKDEHGTHYRCPRCGYDYVTEYCDCPECNWAGMCQEGWV